MKIVNKTQCFSIAKLIFTLNESEQINSEEIKKIQERFISLLKQFRGSESIEYSAGVIKGNGTKLPYSSMAPLGDINSRLVLHFAISFNKPMLFVIDTVDKTVRNYIDIQTAKIVLNEKAFSLLKDELSYSKRMNLLLPKINNFLEFESKYEILLTSNVNENTIVGENCFEALIDEVNEIQL